jgi:hypothetical protein
VRPPELPLRRRLASSLQLANRNKVFDQTPFLGLALDGTGVGRAALWMIAFSLPAVYARSRARFRFYTTLGALSAYLRSLKAFRNGCRMVERV